MSEKYEVRPGDTLSEIAQKKKVPLVEIWMENSERFPNRKSLDLIYEGETIRIPTRA